ncbi:hypothetical protein, partial [Vibrio casei]
MTTLLTLIITFFVLSFCLYHRRTQTVTLSAMAIVMLVSTVLGGFSPIVFGVFIILLALIAIPAIRRPLFSQP